MLNKVIMHCRLTKDPETFKNGDVSWVVLGVAVQRDVKDKKTNTYITDFFNVKFFGNSATIAQKYFKKGSEAVITGRLQTDSYKNKEGKNVQTTYIMGEQLDFCGTKSSNEQNETQNSNSVPAQTFNTGDIDVSDDDLPF